VTPITDIASTAYRRKGDMQCGVFMPYKNCNIETLSRDYATVDEAVFSSCCAKPRRAELSRAMNESLIASPRLVFARHKHLDDARVGKGHMPA
jgi:hypothetical protein